MSAPRHRTHIEGGKPLKASGGPCGEPVVFCHKKGSNSKFQLILKIILCFLYQKLPFKKHRFVFKIIDGQDGPRGFSSRFHEQGSSLPAKQDQTAPRARNASTTQSAVRPRTEPPQDAAISLSSALNRVHS